MRCYTCNMPLSGKEDALMDMARRNVPRSEALDRVGFVRACCRAIEMTTIAHEHNQMRSRQSLADVSDNKARMESLGNTDDAREHATD